MYFLSKTNKSILQNIIEHKLTNINIKITRY